MTKKRWINNQQWAPCAIPWFANSIIIATLVMTMGSACSVLNGPGLTPGIDGQIVSMPDASPVDAHESPYVVQTPVTIASDTNGDGHISPGETGTLRIALQNTGSSEGLGIIANLTTTTAGVTITNGTGLTFGNILPDYYACPNSSDAPGSCFDNLNPSIAVNLSVSAGTVIPFSLAITDTYGNTFTATFNITVGS